MTRRTAARILLAGLLSAGCGDGGGLTAPQAGPPPVPAPPPPPEPETWIGFADPARASLPEGGRVRAAIVVSGVLLRAPLALSVERSGPASEVLAPETVEIEAYGHGAVEIVGISDRRTEPPTDFRITLVPPPEGLPPEVALAAESATFSVSLTTGSAGPDASAWNFRRPARTSISTGASQWRVSHSKARRASDSGSLIRTGRNASKTATTHPSCPSPCLTYLPSRWRFLTACPIRDSRREVTVSGYRSVGTTICVSTRWLLAAHRSPCGAPSRPS